MSGFSFTTDNGVDRGVPGADTGAAGAFGFDVHPAVPSAAITSSPVIKKITSLVIGGTKLQDSIMIADILEATYVVM